MSPLQLSSVQLNLTCTSERKLPSSTHCNVLPHGDARMFADWPWVCGSHSRKWGAYHPPPPYWEPCPLSWCTDHRGCRDSSTFTGNKTWAYTGHTVRHTATSVITHASPDSTPASIQVCALSVPGLFLEDASTCGAHCVMTVASSRVVWQTREWHDKLRWLHTLWIMNCPWMCIFKLSLKVV